MPVRAVLRAGSTGQTLLAAGPWLAWLPLDLLGRLPGTPLRALPLAFGRRRYRAGFVTRRSAEDLEPFRMLEAAVRDAALGRTGRAARIARSFHREISPMRVAEEKMGANGAGEVRHRRRRRSEARNRQTVTETIASKRLHALLRMRQRHRSNRAPGGRRPRPLPLLRVGQ